MTDYYDVPTDDRVCRAFATVAVQTWRDIADFPAVEEGSITDFRILTLKRMCPDEVRVIKFTRWEESRNGADWEWWFGSGHHWFGMRIQAKKLDPGTLEYSHLDYSIKRTKEYQVDRLLDDANTRGLTPLYCLYNYWRDGSVNLPWRCATFAKKLELLGVSVADAVTVRDLVYAGRKRLTDLGNRFFPLNCLTCCRGHTRRGGPGDGLPFRARGISVLLRGAEEGISPILTHPPQYVMAAIEGVPVLEPPTPDLDGILIVQENPEVYAGAYA